RPPIPGPSPRPQLLEHQGVDQLDPVDAPFEVLRPRPARERGFELAGVAEAAQPLAQLGRQLVVDRQPFRARRLAVQRTVEPVETRQLADRLPVIVDAEVDDAVGEAAVAAVALDDEQGGRLLAAAVTPRSLRGGEATE